MKSYYCPAILIALLLSLGAGCAKQPTRVDAFYGTAYEVAIESQVANPNAGVHTGPSLGIVDGSVAEKVIERYEKGFEKPAPKTQSYSVNIGGMAKEKL